MLKALPPQVITSESNEKLKIFKSLLTAKGIKEHKQFILSGEKLIAEFFEQKLTRFKVSAILSDSDIWPRKSPSDCTRFIIPKAAFKELDVVGTNSPLVVVEFSDFEEKDFEKDPQELELICPLGDPKNLGALIRSAVGFGAREIILTKEAAHPFLPQAVKASAGAVLYATFKKSSLQLNEIPIQGLNVALDLQGTPISKIQWQQSLRIWVGEEGPGLKLSPTQRQKMELITIPTQRIESLNAMVSTSIALWEWKKNSR